MWDIIIIISIAFAIKAIGIAIAIVIAIITFIIDPRIHAFSADYGAGIDNYVGWARANSLVG